VRNKKRRNESIQAERSEDIRKEERLEPLVKETRDWVREEHQSEKIKTRGEELEKAIRDQEPREKSERLDKKRDDEKRDDEKRDDEKRDDEKRDDRREDRRDERVDAKREKIDEKLNQKHDERDESRDEKREDQNQNQKHHTVQQPTNNLQPNQKTRRKLNRPNFSIPLAAPR